jgi:hypothetical protein
LFLIAEAILIHREEIGFAMGILLACVAITASVSVLVLAFWLNRRHQQKSGSTAMRP